MALMPKRVKFRKYQRGKRRGISFKGAGIAFGECGLQALENAWLTNIQIEAARVALMRHVKRGGKVWIRIFPDKSVSCLLYTSPSPRDGLLSRMPSSA